MRRDAAVKLVRKVMSNPNIEVLPQTRDSFLRGLDLYRSGPDKTFSLPDCISMAAMREQGLSEVLTNDLHFEQEGFARLMGDCG